MQRANFFSSGNIIYMVFTANNQNITYSEGPYMTNRIYYVALFIVTLIPLAAIFVPSDSRSASTEFRLTKGQTLYVSAYSNIFSGPRKLPFQLATTLSIRNTDLTSSFQVTSIDYFDTDGKLVRRYLEKPLVLGPMASTHVHIEEKDVIGGFGAKYIVRWRADRLMNAPIVECLMIGATSGQGISFVSSGQEIKE